MMRWLGLFAVLAAGAATAQTTSDRPAAAAPRASGLYFGAASGPWPLGCMVRVLLVNETPHELETLVVLANIENGNNSSLHMLQWNYVDPGRDRIAEALLPDLSCRQEMSVTFRRIDDCIFANRGGMDCRQDFQTTQVIANGTGRTIPVRFRHQAP